MGLPPAVDFTKAKPKFPKLAPGIVEDNGQIIVGITPLFDSSAVATYSSEPCLNIASKWVKSAQWLPDSWKKHADVTQWRGALSARQTDVKVAVAQAATAAV